MDEVFFDAGEEPEVFAHLRRVLVAAGVGSSTRPLAAPLGGGACRGALGGGCDIEGGDGADSPEDEGGVR